MPCGSPVIGRMNKMLVMMRSQKIPIFLCKHLKQQKQPQVNRLYWKIPNHKTDTGKRMMHPSWNMPPGRELPGIVWDLTLTFENALPKMTHVIFGKVPKFLLAVKLECWSLALHGFRVSAKLSQHNTEMVNFGHFFEDSPLSGSVPFYPQFVPPHCMQLSMIWNFRLQFVFPGPSKKCRNVPNHKKMPESDIGQITNRPCHQLGTWPEITECFLSWKTCQKRTSGLQTGIDIFDLIVLFTPTRPWGHVPTHHSYVQETLHISRMLHKEQCSSQVLGKPWAHFLPSTVNCM